jgi:hypothetical protein
VLLRAGVRGLTHSKTVGMASRRSPGYGKGADVRVVLCIAHSDYSWHQSFTSRGGGRRLDTTLAVAHNEYKLTARIEARFGEIPEANCNVSELNQVFFNLVVNAPHAIQESRKDAPDGVLGIRTAAVRPSSCGFPSTASARLAKVW